MSKNKIFKKRVAFRKCAIIVTEPCNQVDQNVLHWLLSRSFYISGLQMSRRPFFYGPAKSLASPSLLVVDVLA